MSDKDKLYTGNLRESIDVLECEISQLQRENEALRFALDEITTTDDDETETYNVAEMMRRRAKEALGIEL